MPIDRKPSSPSQDAERSRKEETQSSYSSVPEDRPKKRQKVPIACGDCRSRKIKCDGNPPVCGPCRKRQGLSAICKWDIHDRERSEYVKHLEDKVRTLQQNQPLEDIHQTLSSHPALDRSHGSIDSVDTDYDTPASGARSDTGSVIDRVEGVNAMMGAVDEPEKGFFGSSSAASFIRRVKAEIDKKIGSLEDLPHSQAATSETQLSELIMPGHPRKLQSNQASDQQLPLRKTADNLFDVYWTLVDPLYPFLDKPETMAAYSRIWTGEKSPYDESIFLCALNAIFALSCQLGETNAPEQREALAAVFFERAKGLLSLDLWRGGSIQSVQCLLLMGQYLQSTNDPHRCWLAVGLAVRSAQAIGLHLPSTSAQLRSLRDRQLARKVWHGCVLMDRVVSMTLGRPQAISSSAGSRIPYPAPVDDEYIPASLSMDIERLQPSSRPSKIWFFLESLRLYSILNDVLHAFREPDGQETQDDSGEFFISRPQSPSRTVFETDKDLRTWTQNLPRHLRWPPEESLGEIVCRQANVLRARYLHTRLLLYRPILSSFCTSQNVPANNEDMLSLDEALPLRVALQCSILCVKTAQEQINLIYNKTPKNRMSSGPLPAWWYNVLYVYSAATVLVAARLRSTITSEISETAIASSWELALEVLRRYQAHSISAQRCVAALEILYDKVPSQSEILEQQQRQQKQTTQSEPHPTESMPASHNVASSYENQAPTPWEWMVPQRDFTLQHITEDGHAFGYDGIDFLYHPNDMSWLNSVPSNL